MKNYNSEIKVLYGGSVDKKNIKSIINIKNVDGLLIGSASLEWQYFLEMLNVIE